MIIKQILVFGLPVIAGVALAIQPLLNARGAAPLGGPLWAAAASVLVGLIALCLTLAVTRAAVPDLARISEVPPFAWLAGLLGAFFVFVTIITVPQIGTASLVALVIAGQLIAALVLDHFGLLQERKPASPERLIGAVLLIVGMLLVVRRG
jgi:transporter family-2 protein